MPSRAASCEPRPSPSGFGIGRPVEVRVAAGSTHAPEERYHVLETGCNKIQRWQPYHSSRQHSALISYLISQDGGLELSGVPSTKGKREDGPCSSPLFLLSPGPATDLQEASPVQTSPEERRGASSCPRVPAHLPGALWWLQGSEGYVDFGPCYRCGSIQRLLGYISPLVPLLLASTNLSYIKELEVLQTRRAIRMAAPRARLQRTKTRAPRKPKGPRFPKRLKAITDA